jgi:hypothetical protein
MQYSKITFILLACFLANVPVAGAREAVLCDYYNLYAEFIVSFPKGTPLGRFGASASSGISFIFPDQTKLRINPSIELYDPLYADPGSRSSRPDDENFVLEHAKKGCNVTKMIKSEIDKRTKIVCKNYEYTIIAADNQKGRRYIYIYYDFKNRRYYSLYQSIVESLVLVPENPQNEFEFYRTVINSGVDGDYYDAAVAKDSHQIPNILCGSDRIRDKFIQNPSKK